MYGKGINEYNVLSTENSVLCTWTTYIVYYTSTTIHKTTHGTTQQYREYYTKLLTILHKTTNHTIQIYVHIVL